MQEKVNNMEGNVNNMQETLTICKEQHYPINIPITTPTQQP